MKREAFFCVKMIETAKTDLMLIVLLFEIVNKLGKLEIAAFCSFQYRRLATIT